MSFLNVSLLIAGMAGISIPILIHLLMHRKRKPVMWGAMRFLIEAYKRQRRRILIERWLLLATRCLVIALIAMALGKPLIGAVLGSGHGATVYLVIDNSIASQATDSQGVTALERHKGAARGILAALVGGNQTARVGLVTMGAPAEAVVSPPSSDLRAIRTLVDALEPTDSRADLSAALSIVGAAHIAEAQAQPTTAPSGPVSAWLLSEFRVGTLDAADGPVRVPANVTLVATRPTDAETTNTAITSVEPLRSVVVGDRDGGTLDQVRITLARSGEGVSRPAVSEVRVRVLGSRADASGSTATHEGRAEVRWNAGQESATVSMSLRSAGDRLSPTPEDDDPMDPSPSPTRLTGGIIEARIAADAIEGDNVWRRPVEVRESLRVGVVSPTRFARTMRADTLDAAAWARLALAPTGIASGIDTIEMEPANVDRARLSVLDCLVLPRPDLLSEAAWSHIRDFLDAGKLVIVTPSAGERVQLWPDTMSEQLGLPIELAREAREVDNGRLRLSPPRSVGTGSGTTDTFSLLRAEFDELAVSVAVNWILPIERISGDAADLGARVEPLVSLEAEGTTTPWLVALRRNDDTSRGLLVYIASAMDFSWTDLPAKPLMVPLVQELVRQGIGEARGAWWAVAGSRPLAPARTTELRRSEVAGDGARRESDRTIAVDPSGAVSEPIRRTGLWRAADSRGQTRGTVAVNADAPGGNVATQTADGVNASLGGRVTWLDAGAGLPSSADTESAARRAAAAYFGEATRGSPFWFPLLIAALALGIIEIWAARRASHAELPVTDADTQGVPA